MCGRVIWNSEKCLFSREDWVFELADTVKFCRFETFCLKKKLGPDEWRSASGLVHVYEVIFCEFAKKWNCQFTLNWNLRSMAIGALEIWVMPRISSMWPWPTRMIEGFWASQVVLGPSNYSISPFYPFIDHVIWHALCRSQLLHLQSYNVRFTGAFQQWALGGRQGEGPMRL